MTSFRLLRSSLLHYWRTNLAILLGVVAATAVIGGALIVGDSVRDSLRQMSVQRLGGVDHALTGHRFIREDLAKSLNEMDGVIVAPAIVMPAGVTREVTEPVRRITRAGSVNVYAIDERFWPVVNPGDLSVPTGNEVLLNERTASQLNASVGDEVTLVIEIPPSIPRDSLFGDRDETVSELTLKVAGIADDTTTLGRFGLNPSQQLPLNAFVPLETLQQQLGLSEILPTRRSPVGRPARVNAFFAGGGGPWIETLGATGGGENEVLTQELTHALQLTDLGLKLTEHADRDYFAFESTQMLLEDRMSDIAGEVARERDWRTSPVLVYLLNQIGTPSHKEGEQAAGYSMYSVVAGVDFDDPTPFGPFELIDGKFPTAGGDASDANAPIAAVINDWLADDLVGVGGDGTLIAVGNTVPIEYHEVGDRGELPVAKARLRIDGIVKLAGPAADRGLTPEVEGITDVQTYGDWREPFPLDKDAITDRDDEFWKEHKATPKVFVSLERAQRIWRSRYGSLTSLRVAPREGASLEEAKAEFTRDFLKKLTVNDTGLAFVPVKRIGLAAATGTNDFTGLFLGFSMFLIVAALLLVGLLFRLSVEYRMQELGLLSAVGFTPRQVRRQMLWQGGLLAVCGGVVGVIAAIGYAHLMVYGLKTWWFGAVGTRFLFVTWRPISLWTGLACGTLMGLLAIWWGMRRIAHISPRDQLHGVTEVGTTAADGSRPSRAGRVAAISLTTAGLLLVLSLAGLVPGSEAFGGFSWKVVAFFLVGIASLTGTCAVLAWMLTRDVGSAVSGAGTVALSRLAVRNASRNRARSLLTVCLIAASVFVIVAVASGRRNPVREEPVLGSGNGGFSLLATSSQPILYDLNAEAGRTKAGVRLESAADRELWNSLKVVPFRMRAGDDASCRNLYQTRLPTILGVPADVLREFDRQERFKFADTPGEHPWLSLLEPTEADAIPALGDMNTLMYSLKKGVGGKIEVPADTMPESTLERAELEVRGMFDGSIFQGMLLVSEERFQQMFPEVTGFRYFLIEVPPERSRDAAELLESQLDGSGFDVASVSEQLAGFLAVQNTYLSTFQTLGGLGLLLGTIGLATVMLRNVLERRKELSLLRAVGFRDRSVLYLVFAENVFLLGCGLLAGAASAVLAMAPHLTTTGADVPWASLVALLGLVLMVGMLAPLLAAREATRWSVLTGLRTD
ncbi:MAG: ABC transporter permease [Planctomycetaceae bacterium]